MNRTANQLAVTALIIVVGCAAKRTPEANPFQRVCSGVIATDGATYHGVIFPSHCGPLVVVALIEKVDSYWQPTQENIAALEAGLPRALDLGRSAPLTIGRYASTSPQRAAQVAGDVDEVLSRLSSFRRQYIGVAYRNGQRRILVNFFPGAVEGASDSFSYWKEHWVVVDDGGNSFWRIQYDVEHDRFDDFDANGNA